MSAGPVAPESDSSASVPATSGAESPAPPSWGLPRGVIVLVGLGGAVLVTAGMRSVSELIGPVFLALTLTIAVSPLRSLLIRHGTPRWLAMLAGLVAVYVIIVCLAAAMAYSLARLATLLPTYQEDFADLVANIRSWLADHGIGADEIEAALRHLDLNDLLGVLQSWLGALLGVFSDLTFIVVTLFFMGIDASLFPRRLRIAAQTRPDIAGALSGFARGTVRYLLVSSAFGLIVAAIDVAVLYVLDVPLPLVWGLLAFITNYIPNIGFVIGVIPPAVLALLDSGPATMLWVIVSYCVINFIIQSMIQPKVVGDAVGLSSTLTFLSLVFWAWVLGPLGAVLAIPLSLLVKAVLVDGDPSTRWLDVVLSGGEVHEAPEQTAPPPDQTDQADQADQAPEPTAPEKVETVETVETRQP